MVWQHQIVSSFCGGFIRAGKRNRPSKTRNDADVRADHNNLKPFKCRIVSDLRFRARPQVRFGMVKNMGEMASLLSAHDVARTLNVTLRTAQRLLKAGTVPAFRLNGGPWRVKSADLEAYIQREISAQRNTAGPAA